MTRWNNEKIWNSNQFKRVDEFRIESEPNGFHVFGTTHSFDPNQHAIMYSIEDRITITGIVDSG